MNNGNDMDKSQDAHELKNEGKMAGKGAKKAAKGGKKAVKGTAKVAKGAAKGATKAASGIAKATAFISANAGWIAAAVGIAAVFIFMLMMVLILTDDQGCSQSSSDDNVSITGSAGDWTKKGTKNYNGAKALFSALKNKGADDTQAAGVVGALAHEAGGAFGVPDIAQGYYTWTSNPTEENAGISSPGVASKAEASSGGERLTGASMFQYTPFTKYAPASDKSKWRSYPDLLSYWFKSQVPSMGESISSLKHCDSLSSAVQWTLDVEEGHGSQNAFSDRLSKAHQAYDAFRGTGGSSSDDADSTADSGDSSSSCGSSNDDSDSTDLIKYGMKFKGMTYDKSASHDVSTADKIAQGCSLSDVKDEGTECDDFDWGLLKHCGYKVPSQDWANCTNEMHALKSDEVSAGSTHAGTVGVYPTGSLQHSFILLGKYHGGNTKILSEGPDNVCVCTINWCLTGGNFSTIKWYNVPKK